MVTAVWGTEWIQFLDDLAIWHQDDLKKRVNSSYSSYCSGEIQPILQIVLVQNSYSVVRQGIESFLAPPKQQ